MKVQVNLYFKRQLNLILCAAGTIYKFYIVSQKVEKYKWDKKVKVHFLVQISLPRKYNFSWCWSTNDDRAFAWK